MPPPPDDLGPEPTKHPSESARSTEPLILPYVLDCFEQGQAATEVRKQLVALGCAANEADRLVAAALVIRQRPTQDSAWGESDAPARRLMSVGFTLFVLGIVVGFLRAILMPASTTLASAMNVAFWSALLLGMVVFFVGVARLNIRRR